MIPYSYLKNTILSKKVYPQWTEDKENYYIKLYDGTAFIDESVINKNLEKEDTEDFELNIKPKCNLLLSYRYPFDAKWVQSGKLFRRVHGIEQALVADENVLWFDITYAICKINKVAFLWFPEGIKANFEIYAPDGTTKLNQFGFNVGIAKDFFEDTSNYDADLISGLKIKVSFNNQTGSTKNICVNFYLHEVV